MTFLVDSWYSCSVLVEEPEFKVQKSSDKEVLFRVRKKDHSTARTSYSTGDQFMGQWVTVIAVVLPLYIF